MRRIAARLAAAAGVCGLLAACASSGGGDNARPGLEGLRTVAGVIGATPATGSPVQGGTLTFAGYSMRANLDPAKSRPIGSTGSTELAAVYDTLLRYDAAAGDYRPQLAESFTESGDHLSWTLRLRPGVRFSDGSALDADAVIGSIRRYTRAHGANSDQFTRTVVGMDRTGDDEVVFRLSAPWTGFPALFTFGYGMIIAPAGYADPAGFRPLGAGPFAVRDFTPGVSLTVSARDDYWRGRPPLDTVRFVDISGDKPKTDALRSGDIDMAFLRDPEVIGAATGSFPGYYEPLSLNDVLQINNRDGHPGADPALRRAIAAALDPSALVERAYAGAGLATAEVFPQWSRWHGDAAAPVHDPEQARRLVQQAAAGGTDTTLTYVSLNDPVSQATATAMQAMLGAVGIDVRVDYVATVTDLVKRLYADFDYDIAYGSYSVPDPVAELRLTAALESRSPNNVVGYRDAGMDRLLADAQHAVGDDAKQAAFTRIAQKIHDDVPFVPWATGPNFVPWAPDVHGAVPSNDGIILLDTAWVG